MFFIAFFSIIKGWHTHPWNTKARTITYWCISYLSSSCVLIKLNCLAGTYGFEGNRRDRIKVFDVKKKIILR